MKKIKRILIANRGEIVARILRTAHAMGVEVVVLYTNDDKDHTYLKDADIAVELIGNTLAETFLNKEKIIDIALSNGVDAIHPGYGFLSENTEFARMCESVGVVWIGPSPDVIELMGYKKSARQFAEKHGIPVLKATYGSSNELMQQANEFKYPLMLKALAGGGGKGMRIVKSPSDFGEALEVTAKEAKLFFGNDALYVETFIEKARHIEVQVLGDNFGNVVHLHERECSVQRRHQKLIEEAPASGISEDLRSNLHAAALKLARAAKYKSAGTVEFIVDENENFYFLEMNTRIQVEHPVTEIVLDIDVVKEQLLVAADEALRFTQDEVLCRGHALECRIYAEDPTQGFMPQNGTLTLNAAPILNSTRVDGSFERTAKLSSAYDPLVAKVITDGNSRLEVMKNMRRALKDYQIQGVKTNKGFLTNFLDSPIFIQNKVYTQYLDFHAEKHITKNIAPNKWHAIAWFLLNTNLKTNSGSIWNNLGNWRNSYAFRLQAQEDVFLVSGHRVSESNWTISVDSQHYTCEIVLLTDYKLHLMVNGELLKVIWSANSTDSYFIDVDGEAILVHPKIDKRNNIALSSSSISKSVLSPLPGRVMRVYVSPGEAVTKGKTYMIIESMKIENRIVAQSDAVVKNVFVCEGQQLNSNELMIELE